MFYHLFILCLNKAHINIYILNIYIYNTFFNKKNRNQHIKIRIAVKEEKLKDLTLLLKNTVPRTDSSYTKCIYTF